MEPQKWNTAIFAVLTYVFIAVDAINFAVTSPNIFRLNVAETIGISVSNHSSPVTVVISLRTYPTRKVVVEKRLSVENGKPQIATLTLEESAIPEIQLSSEVALVYLAINAPYGELPSRETLIPVRKYSGYAFIQTDKPIYTPKDIVNIRILNLNEKLTPNDKPIVLEIKNPNGTCLLSKTIAAKTNGIIEDKFTFSTFPDTGIWLASVRYGFQMTGIKTVHFELREYELPTFSVKIEAPKIILNTNEKIETKIIAKYVYGQHVNGFLNIKFGIQSKTNKDLIIQIGSLKKLPIHGDKWVTVKVDRDIIEKNIVWFPEVSGSRFVIEAEVIEKATGHSETTSDHSAIFSYSPYVISFPRSSLGFKPGVIYQVQVNVNFINGKEASEIPFRVVKAVAKKRGVVSRTLPLPLESLTSKLGHIMFELGTGTEDEEIEVTVSTADGNLEKENQATTVLNVYKFQSPDSRSYVWISVPSDEAIFTVKRTFHTKVTVYPAEGHVRLHYLVISRGMIVTMGETSSQKSVLVHPLEFTITDDMTPSARLIVYIIKNNQIIADSIKIQVEKTCKYNNGSDLSVSVDTTSGRILPGDNVQITVTGEANSYVGLLAVDESVYLLKSDDLLTRKSMFDEMEGHDLGCGPGGGRNTEEVFRKSGFFVTSNAHIGSHERIVGECDGDIVQRRKRSISERKPIKMQDLFTGTAAICCRIGRSDGPLGLNCSERAAKIYEAIADAENCSQAFLHCCEKRANNSMRFMNVVRSVLANADDPDNLDEDDLIANFEENLLKGIRKLFPQVWLFNTYKIGNTDCIKGSDTVCRLKFTTNIPHSITSWRVQAIAVSRQTGLCVAESVNAVAFKPVFIQMKLPYSVVRLEQIELPITVFNYQDKEIEVSVYVIGVEGICMGAGPGERSEKKRVSIAPNNGLTVTFPILPLQVGSHRLQVIAMGTHDRDSVEGVINVVHEGFPIYRYETVTLDPQRVVNKARSKRSSTFDANNRQSLQFDTSLPREFIPGTESCMVSAIGELVSKSVTSSIQGLEARYFHLPTGCGEQTLNRLAPFVYSMQYLKRTRRLTPSSEMNGFNLMRNGLSHLLTYRNGDGGFSGYASGPSILWLTARVTKVICQTSTLISVSSHIPCTAIEWMSTQQHSHGSFSGGGIIYTAYVLMAVKECNMCHSHAKNNIISRATNYLEIQLNHINDAYHLALVSYALTLANSTKAATANEKLKNLAIFNEERYTRHWGQPQVTKGKLWIHASRASAHDVEATSYALLTQLLLQDIEYANPIANWLNQQRNDAGDFSSTQDTIIALQALSEYSSRAKLPPLHMVCNVSNEINTLKKSMVLTDENSLTAQQIDMPAGGKIHVDVEGKGVATMSLALRYNVESKNNINCKFELKVESEEAEELVKPQTPIPEFKNFKVIPEVVIQDITSREVQKNKFGYEVNDDIDPESNEDNEINEIHYENRNVVKLDICVRHLGEKAAGMSIIDIGLFTGYKPLKEDLLSPNPSIARYEIFNSSLVLYLNTVPHDKAVCIKLRTVQEISVGGIKPATIKVYDYYEPDNSCEETYKPDSYKRKLSTFCVGKECRCAEGICPPRLPFEVVEMMNNSFDQRQHLLHLACNKHNFVWNGTVTGKRQDENFVYYDFYVSQVIKEGLEQRDSLINEVTTFTGKLDCPLKLEVGKVYVIMGQNGFRSKDSNDIVNYKYTFDQNTSVYEMLLLRDITDHRKKELQKCFLWLYKRFIEKLGGCNQ